MTCRLAMGMRDAQPVSWTTNWRMAVRVAGSRYDTYHCLSAECRHLDGLPVLHEGDEGDDTVVRKVGMRMSIPRMVEDVAPLQVNGLRYGSSAAKSSGGSEARKRFARCLANPLSERERQVFVLLGEGRSNKEIATELGLSVKTTKWYVSCVLNKLGVVSRLQVAIAAGYQDKDGLDVAAPRA